MTTTPTTKKRSTRQQLRDYLLKDYDKMAHPVLDDAKPVSVGVGLAVIHVDLDEKNSALEVDAWMRLKWTDEHLRWDASAWNGNDVLHFGHDEIWKPDILLYNSAQLQHQANAYGDTHFVVTSDGGVLWVPPAKLRSFCRLNLRAWPLDEQTCVLKFGSWTSHGEQISLELYNQMKEAETHNIYTNKREWQLLGKPPAKHENMTYPCCVEPYPEVTFTFKLKRNSPAYMSVIVAPCLIMTMMAVFTFLLPPAAGEKVTINGFAFLGCVMYLIHFAKTLPFHAGDAPVIVTFYGNTAALLGLGLLINVSCLSMSRLRKYTGPPRLLTSLFAGPLGKFLCLGHYYHQVSSTHQRLVLELSDMDLAESEQGASSGGGGPSESAGPSTGRTAPGFADASDESPEEARQSGVMRDWTLVAAGVERLALILYTLVFLVELSVYV